MFRRVSLLMVAALVIFGLTVAASAQDEEQPLTPVTLEELTADPAPYYGMSVALEGVLEEYVNSNSFILGEGAALDNDRVLVINNSGQVLPVDFFVGEDVVVSGVVHPSLDDFTPADAEGEMTPEAEMTPDTDMGAMTDTVEVFDFYYNGNYPDDYNPFTVIEVTSVNSLQLLDNDNE